jgi:hypothetical protein
MAMGRSEPRTFALTGACGASVSPVKFNEMFDDGQPKAETTVRSRSGTILLTEPVKNIGKKFRRNPLTRIIDTNFRV